MVWQTLFCEFWFKRRPGGLGDAVSGDSSGEFFVLVFGVEVWCELKMTLM